MKKEEIEEIKKTCKKYFFDRFSSFILFIFCASVSFSLSALSSVDDKMIAVLLSFLLLFEAMKWWFRE